MKKVGVVLSGCGVYDGAEIHETVLTLLAIARNGAQAVCFAPDKQQADGINHLTGEPMLETRNVLIEAARITRGEIRPLAQAVSAELDALIVPGGFGAAKNLSNFASQGSELNGLGVQHFGLFRVDLVKAAGRNGKLRAAQRIQHKAGAVERFLGYAHRRPAPRWCGGDCSSAPRWSPRGPFPAGLSQNCGCRAGFPARSPAPPAPDRWFYRGAPAHGAADRCRDPPQKQASGRRGRAPAPRA